VGLRGPGGDCGGIGIPATSPVISGGRCAEPGRKGTELTGWAGLSVAE